MINNEEYTQKSFTIMDYIHNKLNMKQLTQNYIQFFSETMKDKMR